MHCGNIFTAAGSKGGSVGCDTSAQEQSARTALIATASLKGDFFGRSEIGRRRTNIAWDSGGYGRDIPDL
jgi:hypothetical protein